MFDFIEFGKVDRSRNESETCFSSLYVRGAVRK